MKRYKCRKELILDYCDAEGLYVEGEQIEINVGDIYEYDEDFQKPLIISAKTGILLDLTHDITNRWIEIYPETLVEYFEEMTEGENGKETS